MLGHKSHSTFGKFYSFKECSLSLPGLCSLAYGTCKYIYCDSFVFFELKECGREKISQNKDKTKKKEDFAYTLNLSKWKKSRFAKIRKLYKLSLGCVMT
jgi:hypothetical protein